MEDDTASKMLMDNDVMTYLVKFLTGDFPYSMELQAFGIAVQGAMLVRKGPNAKGNLSWWHAFCLSMICGFGGGWMGFVWLAKPSSMLANDVNAASVILAFLLVNYTPFDVGFMLCNTLPVTIVYTSFAQLFRSLGIMKFVMACFDTFKGAPSAYYPIPVFGPIMYATLLGNMGSFLLKGFEGYIKDGMPWNFQNGLFCATFFHFYANDETGIIGTTLRQILPGAAILGLSDHTFATCFIGAFMQIMGTLHLPAFLGPAFSPFVISVSPLPSATPTSKKAVSPTIEDEKSVDANEEPQYKSKRKQKKKKKTS